MFKTFGLRYIISNILNQFSLTLPNDLVTLYTQIIAFYSLVLVMVKMNIM